MLGLPLTTEPTATLVFTSQATLMALCPWEPYREGLRPHLHTVPEKQSRRGRVRPTAGRGGGGTAAAEAAGVVVAVLFVVCFQVVAMAGFGTCLVVLVSLSSSSVAVQLLFSIK